MDSVLSAYAALTTQSNAYQQNIKQLTTGKRINSASDDPSGYVRAKLFEKESRNLAVQYRTAERDMASAETVSSRYDQAANITERISELYGSITDFSSDAERQAVRREVDELKGVLDSVLSDTAAQDPSGGSELSSAASGFDSLSEDNAESSQLSANHSFESIISRNASVGSHIRSQQVQQNVRASQYINTRAQLSTIEDADMMENSINAQSAAIRMRMAMYMMKSSNNEHNQQFNGLF